MRTPTEWAQAMAWDVSQFELMIGDVQKEAYNQAIDDAAGNAERFAEFYIDDKGTEDAIKQSLLKLKKA